MDDLYFEPEIEPLLTAAAIVIATRESPGAAATLGAEPVGDKTLLDGLLERLESLPLVVVVVREESHAELAGEHDNVVVLVDPEWEEPAAPLRAALDYLAQAGNIDEAFVVAVDTPALPPEVLADLSAARRDLGSPIVVPKYRYVRGGPALIGDDLWPHFLGMEGELDVDAHLLAHPQWVAEVRVDYAPPRRIADAAELEEFVR